MLSSSRDSSSARRAVLLRIAHEQQERNGQLDPKHGQVRHALGGTAFAVLGPWERRSTARPHTGTCDRSEQRQPSTQCSGILSRT